ncbi:MAG: hypothetical protein JXR69_04850 [Candidatus Delongbacteria bacterium]|nr:hypothetical protein [Candidatus Delongbacteria bacterium]
MIIKYLLFIIFSFNVVVLAEHGYVFRGDLNEDGLIDSIKSGPSVMFGNGGGPFIIWLGQKDGNSLMKITGFHPKAVALEKNGSKSKLWNYNRAGASQGSLGYTILDSTFKKEFIHLDFNKEFSGLSSKIYKMFFREEYLIKFEYIDNYTPPEYHWGK